MTPSRQLSLPEQVASQAEFIVNNLSHTDYQHLDNIHVDAGVFDCDCNGFAAFVLQRAAPDHYKLVPIEDGHVRPRAYKYYEFFASLTSESTDGWHQIHFLQDARRGDMMAWRFPIIEKGHDTGHVLFVAETPEVDDKGVFSVRVYDSAATPHFSDTRGNGAGEFGTGIGFGIIKFHADAAGKPTAFQFAPSDGFETLPIAIGRLEPLP